MRFTRPGARPCQLPSLESTQLRGGIFGPRIEDESACAKLRASQEFEKILLEAQPPNEFLDLFPDIAQTIIDKKADYILALKGNQGTLKDDVKLLVDEQKTVDFKDAKISRDKTVDGDHGRIETREITVIHDVEWLQERHDWPGLKSVVVVESTREVGGKIDREMRLYITSLVLLAHQIGPMIRGHWMIENGLHWVLDMVFRDDECRVRTDNAPANLATLKHMAYNVMRRAATKDSMRLRRKVAAWDDDFLASLIAA